MSKKRKTEDGKTDKPRSNQKDVWDKLKIVSALAGATLIPLAVLTVGYWVNSAVTDREIALEKFKMALDQLVIPEEQHTYPALRAWASYEFEKQTGVSIDGPGAGNPAINCLDACMDRGGEFGSCIEECGF